MNNKPKMFSSWSDVTSGERNQLVFEHRNQSYGAYEIRKNYDRTLLKALSSAFLIIILISGFSFLPSHHIQTFDFPLTPAKLFDLPPVTPPDIPKIIPPVTPPPGGPISHSGFTPPMVVTDTMMPDSFPLLAMNTSPSPGNRNDSNTPGDVPIEGNGGAKQGSELPPDTVFEFPSDRPEFPGGDKELMRFLRSNTIIPEPIKEIGRLTEKIGVVFIIERDGSVSSASVLRGGSKYAELNNEAIRVINKMPRWEPGKQNGNKVKVRMILPFRFEVK